MNKGQKRILSGEPVSNRMACGKIGEVTTSIYADSNKGMAGISYSIKEDTGEVYSSQYETALFDADAHTLWRAKRLLEIVPAISGETLRDCFLAASGDKPALQALKEDAKQSWWAAFNGHSAGAGDDFDWVADQVVKGRPSQAELREVEGLIYNRDDMLPEILKTAQRRPWYGNNLA